MTDTEARALRWGIVATGFISSWFVDDLWMDRPSAKVKHIVQAVGTSSREKGDAFVRKHCPAGVAPPTVYGSYQELYSDPDVDIIYVGTPHAFHRRNCLDAIGAGKHVLCEKAFTINAREAREVFAAAASKGVFVMEAMWTRFFPLVKTLEKLLHTDKIIGSIRRVFCDNAMDFQLESLGPDSRLKNPALGGGALLDAGVYSLTWTLLCLGPAKGRSAETPKVAALQTIDGDIDVASSAVLLFADGRQGIVTTSAQLRSTPRFCRIEGTKGYVEVEGLVTPLPRSFTVHSTTGSGEGWAESSCVGMKQKTWHFDGAAQRPSLEEFGKHPGKGFFWEADAAADAILAGKKETDTMPWEETIRVLEILDEIRKQGGGRFPQDDL